jgi:2-keto-3-deoxy-L-rhamnonate aldolase RhmA
MTIRSKLQLGRTLAGTFVKTPSAEVIEIMALANIDFVCLDTEHSAISRREMDWCLALCRSLGLASFVRLTHASPETVLQALDSGADGIVVPHVTSLLKAIEVARWARFGPEGRGYAGSTRAGGFTSKSMAETLAGGEDCFVMAQIEDPSALQDVEAIAGLVGIDGLFFGAADMAVGLGLRSASDPFVDQAFNRVAEAAKMAGKPLAAYCSSPGGVSDLARRGVHVAFVGSDQGMVLSGARAIASVAQV